MKILITGGNGFIGQYLCKMAYEKSFSEIIAVDMIEYNPYSYVKVEIGSITNLERMEEIFNKYKPDVVIHAAAHKHINLMETMPKEAIDNNIIGTMNIFDCCIKYNVQTCIFISTDKANFPSSVYGMTKQIGERLIKTYSNFNKTKFISARFCNVYGSSGSVVPIFKKCIEEKKPLPITDFRMTRYFISPEQACNFIFNLINLANNGDICMLNVEKDINIKELAELMLKEAEVDLPLVEIGLRPGEKLHEDYSVLNGKLLKDNIYIMNS